jgi:D-alanyl-D-alanine endopeptidase (penicillin-binding protein 7)
MSWSAWCVSLACVALLGSPAEGAFGEGAANAVERDETSFSGESALKHEQCWNRPPLSWDGAHDAHAGFLTPDGLLEIAGMLAMAGVDSVPSAPYVSGSIASERSSMPTSEASGATRGCAATVSASPSSGQTDTLRLLLSASAVLVIDQGQWHSLYEKAPRVVRPIASITKLMTAMVALDANAPPGQVIQIQRADVDMLKRSGSRLRVGTRLTRDELLRLALMASENRAASALSRAFPGGHDAFVAAMNQKAAALGMRDSRFVDSTGLNPENVSTAFDLAVMVNAAYQYPAIRQYTTAREHRVAVFRGRALTFHNSNRLLSNQEWDIGLSKTGYIREAGRCLVMQSMIDSKPVIIVILDAVKKASRMADANRIRGWVSESVARTMRTAVIAAPGTLP